MDRELDRTARSLSLTTGGLTLLSVLFGIGVSVGFGVQGTWWVKVLAGAATTCLLIAIVKLGTSAGHGPMARLANWVIGQEDRPG